MAERRPPGWTEGIVVGLMLGGSVLLFPVGGLVVPLVPWIAAGVGCLCIAGGCWLFFRR